MDQSKQFWKLSGGEREEKQLQGNALILFDSTLQNIFSPFSIILDQKKIWIFLIP